MLIYTYPLFLAFNEVAAHDIEWGNERVEWLSTDGGNERKRVYVTSPPS